MGSLLWLVGIAFAVICINMAQEWPRYHRREEVCVYPVCKLSGGSCKYGYETCSTQKDKHGRD